MKKQEIEIKWYDFLTRIIILGFVESGLFVGFRSVVHGDPLATSVIGLALVYFTAKELW